MIRGFIAIGLVGVIWLQAGCAQILVPGTMAGAGELYRYTTTNVAKQTFVGNMDQMTAATKIALKNMKMELGSVNRGDTETVLHASASALEIRIQLEPVTPATTRVTVNATKDHWIKDKATANEILSQIGNSLKTKISAAKHFSSVFIKNECDRPIRVAVYYLAGPEGSETWETRGWFFMKPGNKKQIAETKNRYLYIYAESGNDAKLVWAGDNHRYFKGKRYGFFRVDIGRPFIDFTQTFTCE